MTAQADAPVLPARLTLVRPAPASGTAEPPRVLLVAEGTYPFHWGGVSTWCDALVRALPQVPFWVLAIAAQPGEAPVFDRPANVVEFRSVPLWGLQDVKETWTGAGLGSLHRARARTTGEAVERGFIPPLRRFLRALFDPCADPDSVARQLRDLYRFLLTHDLDRALRSPQTWEVCAAELQAGYDTVGEPGLPALELWELTTALQWVGRWLFPLAAELPAVDVVHAAMAGACSIVSVVVKLEHGAGFLLTEHGVYLRERYLAEADRTDSHFLKLLGLCFARRMTEMSYAMADQISPCCDYNQRWELEIGAGPERLETIYYGMEGAAYVPAPSADRDPFLVVWVGRINPLKDVETLLHAAARVVAARPDARFRLYGTAPAEDADYLRRCLALHVELGLEEAVSFCGYTDDPSTAYNEADVVVLSSVSEGFPFSTLEAMLCGRPVVATSVGGLPEQIADAGIVVEPRDADAMAAAVLSLLGDRARCRSLGVAARERAVVLFAAKRFSGAHHSSYHRLSGRHQHWQSRAGGAHAHDGVRRLRLAPRPRALDHPARTARHAARHAAASGTDDLSALAQTVHARSGRPVDELEVAAVLESSGVTDATAQGHGYTDVFRLAEAVFDRLRTGASPQRDMIRSPAVTAVPEGRDSHLDTARHAWMALVPTVALLAAVWFLTTAGQWGADRVLALTVGLTSGMLVTNGLALAMGRRASSLLSLGKTGAARRFFGVCTVTGTAGAALLASGALLLPVDALGVLREHRATFLVGAVVLSLVWLLAAALSMVRRSGGLGLGLGAGVLSGVAVDQALQDRVGAHVAVAVAAGSLVVVLVLLAVLERALRARTVPSSAHVRLPSPGYLVLEGLPYLVYGTSAAVMFISVHLIGWAYVEGVPRGLTTVEIGLFLPLLPAVLAFGGAERSLRLFWGRAAELQSLPALDRADFGRGLRRFHDDELRAWAGRLLRGSVGCLVVLEVSLRSGVLMELVPYADADAVRVLVVCGLVGYALMAWAQFSSMFCLSLLRPHGPLVAVLAGTAATVGPALVLSAEFGYLGVGPALVIGAAVYAWAARRAVLLLFASADHRYAAAL